MPPEPPPFHLREPTTADALLPGWWLPHILIGSSILIALLIIAFLLVRMMKRPRPADPRKIREEARLNAATKLEASRTSATTPRDAAVLASLALRDYLSIAAEDPALFETHEEFIARRDSLAALNPQTRNAAADGFSKLASLKYAAQPPAADPRDVIESARTLLDTLHRGFTEP